MKTIPHTYRITPESKLKLKFLSSAMDVSMSKLIDLMINNLWNEKGGQVTTVITSQQSSREAGKTLRKMELK